MALGVAALLLATTLHAQTPAQDSVRVLRADLDSLNRELAKIDSLKGRFQRAYQAAYHPTRWYAGALASGVAVNAVFHLDRDPGGYVDSWGTPDKFLHFSVGSFLVDRASMLRVPLRYAVPLTCAAAVGFEYSQGYASWKDAVAGCSGAAFSGAMRWVVRHYPRDQNRETVHTWTRRAGCI